MKEILFLAHRIPFPPNKGDKIRSFNVLMRLTERYKIHLGAFMDDPNDRQYLPNLAEICASHKIIEINPRFAQIKCLLGLLDGGSLSVKYYRSSEMFCWVEGLLQERNIDGIFLYSSVMGQYAFGHKRIFKVMDFVDIDSEKWKQYSARFPWPLSWIYRRESARLREYEISLVSECDQSFFVSKEEAALFCDFLGDNQGNIGYFRNGVSTEYFDPEITFENPYIEGGARIVFTGAMDYWPNVDAVEWFVREVYSASRLVEMDVQFFIVGSNPSRRVLELGSIQGVNVIGSVPDVRPYLKYADIAIAPLRIARGIQNKVLEAMSMGRFVVMTEAAATGLGSALEGAEVAVVDDVASWRHSLLEAIGNKDKCRNSAVNRRIVMENFSWDVNLEPIIGLWK